MGLKQSAAAAFLLAAKVPGKTSQNPQSNRIDEFLADCLVKKRKMPRGPKKRFDADSAAIRRASVSVAVTRMSGNTRNDGGRTQTKREEALLRCCKRSTRARTCLRTRFHRVCRYPPLFCKNKMNSLSTHAGRFQAAFGGKETGWGRSQAAITRQFQHSLCARRKGR